MVPVMQGSGGALGYFVPSPGILPNLCPRWGLQSRVGQSLVGCPPDSLFTVEQQRRLLESVSPGLDEEEPPKVR
jgi:hypothetical protein